MTSTKNASPESVTLGDVVKRTGGILQTGPFGSQLHARDYITTGTPLVMPINLGDNEIQDAGIARIGERDAKRLRRHALRKGDIIFSRRGDVGRRALVREEQAGWLCGTGCLAARFGKKLDDVNPKYVAEYLGSAAATSWLTDNAVGGTMPNLNTRILAALPLLLPPRAEQDAIVDLLEGARWQVKALERIVAKKQAIKQGLMQQLLTGKTRLPGFTGEWVTLRVAARSELKARIGWQGLTTAEYRNSGTHRLVGGTEFVDGSVDWNSTPYVDKWRYDQDVGIQLREGDVLLTKDGSIGKIAYVDELPGRATLNSGVFVMRPIRDAYDSRFLYFMLRSRAFEDFLTRLAAGSTISHLYQRDLVKLVLEFPATLKEQGAIAKVLWDMDSEVVALKARLAKARLVQVGMMQELLTGRTRLPTREVVA